MRIQSSILNEVIEDSIARNPAPTDKGKRLRIYYQRKCQLNHRHSFIVNEPEMMHLSYERFENRIRDTFDFEELDSTYTRARD